MHLKIKLKLLMPFKNIVGKDDFTIVLEGSISTLQDLLDNLTDQYPKLNEAFYNQEGKVDSFVNIFINEKPTYSDQESKIMLNDGDLVLIFPAIAGG